MHVAAVLDGPGLFESGFDEGGTATPIVANTGCQFIADKGFEAAQVGATDGSEEGSDRLGWGGCVRKARESGYDLVVSRDLGPSEDTVAVDGLAACDRGALG